MVPNCCGNDKCEPGETYENCSGDCPNCDDGDKCTEDGYDYHEQKCISTPVLDLVCCGNGLCQMGETYLNCARDCPNCNDDNECTVDGYDYHERRCINEPMIPCCGDSFCEEGGETYTDCPTDCPSCDDGYALTTDSFNYSTQECSHSPSLVLAEGYRYAYVAARCPQCAEHDSFIYVTNETTEYWEGIAGSKVDHNQKAYLMRWRLEKDNLDVSITLPLTEDKLSGEGDYISDVKQIQNLGEAGDSLLPLYITLLKEMLDLDIRKLVTEHRTSIVLDSNQTIVFSTSYPVLYGVYPAYRINVEMYSNDELMEAGEIVMSAVEPYLIMEFNVGEGPKTSFKRGEKKEFSLGDFEGYSLSVWEPPPPSPDEPKKKKE
ncbi:MAG: hypothetical protein U9M95_05145 [Candidatus Altiarchaeota archaeon]|nr:hypothetical protein [Candidatus Altiarchaeota archaeon]